MEKENFNKIIEVMKEARTDTKSKVSDEVLFQMATDVYISEFIQSNYRQGKKPFDSSFSSPATPNQIWKLKRLGCKEDTSKLTRGQASDLIDKLKGGISWKNTQNLSKALIE